MDNGGNKTYGIPTGLRNQIKVSLFNALLLPIGDVLWFGAGMLGLAMSVNIFPPSQFGWMILYMISLVSLIVILDMPSFSNPGKRNYQMLIFYIRTFRDKKSFRSF